MSARPSSARHATSRTACVALGALATLASCARSAAPADPVLPAEAAIARALRPSQLVASLRAAGGGQVTARTRIFARADAPADAGWRSPQTVTTSTSLWMDADGNFRLVEDNDRDGAREVVRVGGQLAVALKYGKATLRPAREPEPSRFLEEALGGPAALWELLSPAATLTPTGDDADGRRWSVSLRAGGDGVAGGAEAGPLSAWRGRARVSALSGELLLARDPVEVPLRVRLGGKLRVAGDGESPPLDGEVEVTFDLTRAGGPSAPAPAIRLPDAGALSTPQRTLQEERLLDGLPGRRDPARVE